MIDVSYTTAPCPVRADIEEAHTFFWQKLAAPGTWWTGAERVAIGAEVRQARHCQLCQERKAAQEAGASAAVLVGYLVGLGLVQYGLALLAGCVVHNLLKATAATHIHARLAGAVVAGVGMFCTLENIEGLVFNMLGLAV